MFTLNFEIKVDTSLRHARNSFSGEDTVGDYANYLSEEIASEVEPKIVKADTLPFGDIITTIYLDNFDAVYDDFYGCVNVKMIVDNDMTEEEIYDIVNEDEQFHIFLKNMVDEFLSEVNEKITSIKHPYGETLAFIENHLYMMINTYDSHYNPDWQSFKYDDDIDEDKIADNYLIT